MEANAGQLAESTLCPDGHASMSDNLTEDGFAWSEVAALRNQGSEICWLVRDAGGWAG